MYPRTMDRSRGARLDDRALRSRLSPRPFSSEEKKKERKNHFVGLANGITAGGTYAVTYFRPESGTWASAERSQPETKITIHPPFLLSAEIIASPPPPSPLLPSPLPVDKFLRNRVASSHSFLRFFSSPEIGFIISTRPVAVRISHAVMEILARPISDMSRSRSKEMQTNAQVRATQDACGIPISSGCISRGSGRVSRSSSGGTRDRDRGSPPLPPLCSLPPPSI